MAGRYIGGLWGIFAVGLALLVGCTSTGAIPVTGETGQASVQSVEVVQSLSQPGEVRLLVKGTLPDSCTQLVEPVVSRSGGLAVVIMMQQPLAGQAGCRALAQPFERLVSLGKDLAPGRYAASVNGVQQVFELPAPAALLPGVAGSAAEAVPAAVVPAQPVGQPQAVEQPAVGNQPAVENQPVAEQQPAVGNQPAGGNQPAVENQPVVEQQPEVGNQPVVENQPPAPAQDAGQPAPANPPEPAAQGGQGQPASCENKAAFFADVSIPDGTLFDPGQEFTKTWRVRNAGTCAWQGYAVIFKDGDPLSPQERVDLQSTVAVGDTVDISVKMIAPQKPGGYYSDWLIAAGDGSTFGLGAGKNGRLWTKIGVRTLGPVNGDTPGSGSSSSCAYQTDASAESQVLELINQARLSRGLEGLQVTEKLSAAARGHSQDMACKNFVEHFGSDGSTWYARIQAQGVRYKSASENIYAGAPQFGGTPQGAFDWWMNSQVHRDNILNPKFKQIGVGYIYSEGSTYKGYYTLNFITP